MTARAGADEQLIGTMRGMVRASRKSFDATRDAASFLRDVRACLERGLPRDGAPRDDAEPQAIAAFAAVFERWVARDPWLARLGGAARVGMPPRETGKRGRD